MEIEAFEATFRVKELPSQVDNLIESWNGRKVSYKHTDSSDQKVQFVMLSTKKSKEKEIARLQQAQPSKQQDPQGYYTYKARIEQLRYEVDISHAGKRAIFGHLGDSWDYYWKAHNHLKRRTEAEAEANKAYLQQIKNGGNPPSLDIGFINSGKKTSFAGVGGGPRYGVEVSPAPGGQGAQVGYGVKF